jgi:hypothetical protein
MKSIALLTFLTFTIHISVPAPAVHAWGLTGHRTIGFIAQKHLTPKARKAVEKVLGGQSLAYVGTWMDDLRSYPEFAHLDPWHYCTIPDGKSYEEAGTPEQGDIIVAIERFTEELRTRRFREQDEAFALRCLIHLVGDVHQPLHVGRGDDRGGNDVRVKWFREDSNLHRVWDSDMIDHQRWSASELAAEIDRLGAAQIAALQNSVVRDWARESMALRPQIYQLPDDMTLAMGLPFAKLEVAGRAPVTGRDTPCGCSQ